MRLFTTADDEMSATKQKTKAIKRDPALRLLPDPDRIRHEIQRQFRLEEKVKKQVASRVRVLRSLLRIAERQEQRERELQRQGVA